MEKISIKAYAAKHKLSIFNVVKMTKSGQLPTQTVEENGKETIRLDGSTEKSSLTDDVRLPDEIA